MLRTINRKFYFFALVLAAIFSLSYLQIALFLEMQDQIEIKSKEIILLQGGMHHLQSLFFEMRFWDKSVLGDRHPEAQSRFGERLENIRGEMAGMLGKDLDPLMRKGLTECGRILNQYEAEFSTEVQLKTEERLSRTRMESAFQLLLSMVLALGDTHTSLLPSLFSMNQFQSAFLSNHRDSEYQALLLVADSLEIRLAKTGKLDDRFKDHLLSYRDIVKREMDLNLEWLEVSNQFDNTSSLLSEQFSTTTSKVESLLKAQLQAGQDSRQALRRNFTISTVLGICCLLFAIYFISRLIISPVNRISEVIRKVSGGDLNARLIVGRKGRDEIVLMGQALNSMLDALEKNHQNLILYKNELEKKLKTLAFRESELLAEISERKKLEQERALLAEAVEQASESVMVTDPEGIVQYVNPAFQKLSGVELRNVVGKRIEGFESLNPEMDILQAVRDALIKGNAWNGKVSYRTREEQLITFEAIVSPIKDSHGNIVNCVAIGRDVSREEELNERLRQAQKMESIGTMAGGIAHDFNNILASILGFTEMVLNRIPEDSEIRDDLTQVMTSGQRASELVKQILTFSRRSVPKWEPLDIGLVIKDVLKLLRASIPATVEIHQEINSSATIMGDATQLHQVVMNLCVNANQSMGSSGGVLDIRMFSMEMDEEMAKQYPDLQAGPYVCLRVSDTGQGMAPGVMSRIFEPYFTTKEKGKGTGLGLSLVHGIVKGHGGAITVSSEAGKGATFNVYLPVVRNKDEKSLPTPGKASMGKERILFVDDETNIVLLGKRMLERLGYEVTAFSSGLNALEYFVKNYANVDILITDMTMPKINGAELSSKCREHKPGLPVIIITGFSDILSETDAMEMDVNAVIPKPFMLKNLARVIRKVLDEAYDGTLEANIP